MGDTDREERRLTICQDFTLLKMETTMYLVQPIRSASQMRNEFLAYGRESQFSYAGFDALFEYLENFADAMGEPIEFDVLALCCGWCEYADPDELAEAFSIDRGTLGLDADADEDDFRDALLDEMNGHGMTALVEGGSILFSMGW